MMAPFGKTNFLQPCCSFLHRGPVGNSSHEKRHSNVLLCRKLRQQIVNCHTKPISRLRKSATSPSEPRSRVPRMCSRLLFPDPDSPTMASISPFLTWKDKLSKSTKSVSPDL